MARFGVPPQQVALRQWLRVKLLEGSELAPYEIDLQAGDGTTHGPFAAYMDNGDLMVRVPRDVPPGSYRVRVFVPGRNYPLAVGSTQVVS